MTAHRSSPSSIPGSSSATAGRMPIAVANDNGGDATTEDLRIAMQDFRALFVELVEQRHRRGVAGTRPSGALGVCHLPRGSRGRCGRGLAYETASPPKPAGRPLTLPSEVSEPFPLIRNALMVPAVAAVDVEDAVARDRLVERVRAGGQLGRRSARGDEREAAVPGHRVGGDRVGRRVGGVDEAPAPRRRGPAGRALAVHERRRDRRERIELVGAERARAASVTSSESRLPNENPNGAAPADA